MIEKFSDGFKRVGGPYFAHRAPGLNPSDNFHFIGIGGIGMSGIAELLRNYGYKVRGSDRKEGPRVEHLRSLGVKIYKGHRAENLSGLKKGGVTVFSSAVGWDNIEMKTAMKMGLPVVRRSDMLSALMRVKPSVAVGGSHGKTTVTSLIAHVLEKGGFDPTVILGGIVNSWGSNLKLGNGKWMVCEADESDGSFTDLPATASVITNIDAEHLETYGEFANLEQAFYRFAAAPPFYGFTVLNEDDPSCRRLLRRLRGRTVLTFGLKSGKIRAEQVKNHGFSSEFLLTGDKARVKVKLPLGGNHNVLNALAAAAVALRLGMSPKKISQALSSFGGVRRRFSKVGVVDGITIIDDYAHHPKEIRSTLAVARKLGRVIAVVEPHRYSRVAALLGDFAESFKGVAHVVVTDIYGAGEKPLPGIHADALADTICRGSFRRERGKKRVWRLRGDYSGLANIIGGLAEKGDIVVLMGAGSLTNAAAELPSKLKKLGRGKSGEGRQK